MSLNIINYYSHFLFDLIQFRGERYSKDAAAKNWRKLNLKLHPDRQPAGTSSEALTIINQAYNILNNKKSHLRYAEEGDTDTELYCLNWEFAAEVVEWIYNNEEIKLVDESLPYPTLEPDLKDEEDDRERDEEWAKEQNKKEENRNNWRPESPEEGEDEPIAAEDEQNNTQKADKKRRAYMKKIEKILGDQDRKCRGTGLQFKIKWAGVNVAPAWEQAGLIAEHFPMELKEYITKLGPKRQKNLLKNYTIIEELFAN